MADRSTGDLGALREVPYMGVIWVVHEASKLGFWNGNPDWSNLGQGQPEVGPMAGAPPRLDRVEIQPQDHAYGPLGGTDELREVVAAHYNRLYRAGKRSRYTKDHVCIAQGGRLALSRAFATLGAVNVGYQLPDYTAYEDMLSLHLARLAAVPLPTRREEGWQLTAAQLAEEVLRHGLSAFVLSNPCNPTGNVVQGEELARMVALSRERGLTLLLDEFYSHFVYEPANGFQPDGSWRGEGSPPPAGTPRARPAAGPVSAAAYVEDVDEDPVLLFDGLTKSFRYPGWRVGWIVGPPAMLERIARTASALDGGPSRIAQRAALEVLEPARADQETRALREVFCAKRNEMVDRLGAMGLIFAREPLSTFYCWASLERLAPPFDDPMEFFRRALQRKVMTVPGQFFDVNPGHLRRGPSPWRQWMRFSFGPPLDNMRQGLERLEGMLRGR